MSFEREIRLLVTLALAILVPAVAYRWLRRTGRSGTSAASDSLLIFFFCQYISVVIPGLLGVLSSWTIAVASLMFGVVLWVVGNGAGRDVPLKPLRIEVRRRDRFIFAAGLGMAIGYVAGYAWVVRWLPVVSNDAMTYHFPAAAQWLQQGKLALYQAWYYNPANTYSPLAGSTFIAWWMGLSGDDVLARYVQIPPLVLIGLASFNLLRRLRCSVLVSTLLMMGVMLCNPILSQATMGKDDLYVTAFFIAGVMAMTRGRDLLQSGIAIGPMLACKTTALLTFPVLLLLVGRPVKARQWAAIAIGASLLAGPWYLRNWMLTGDPVFPVDFLFFKGLCATTTSPQLRTVTGIVQVLFRGVYAIPAVVAVILFVGLIAGLIVRGKSLARSGLYRIVLLGPWLGIGLFLLLAPFAEVRFILPIVPLAFAAVGIAISRLCGWPAIQVVASLILVGLSAVTSFYLDEEPAIVEFLMVMGLCLLAAVGVTALNRQYRPLAGLVGGAGLVLVVYVYWNSYVDVLKLDSTPFLRSQNYGNPIVDAWTKVDQDIPENEAIAYANTFYVYPLMGPRQQRPIAYAPVRPGLHALHDLPRMGGRLNGEELATAARAAQVANPEEAVWLENLRKTRVKYLFVQLGNEAIPELAMVQKHSARFAVIFRNEAAIIYRINW